VHGLAEVIDDGERAVGCKNQGAHYGQAKQFATLDGQNVGYRALGSLKTVGRQDVLKQPKEFVLKPLHRYKGY